MPTTTKTTSSSLRQVSAYARKVVRGKIVAGPHVRNACQRHLDDVKHCHERGFEWNDAAAEKALAWFPRFLRHSEGKFAKKAVLKEGEEDPSIFKLHTSQVFIVGSLFGWTWIKTGYRRFRTGYIEMGKGNGKTPLAGGIALYGLMADAEAGAQIYSAASKKDQAALMFRDAVKMARANPKLSRRLRFSGGLGNEYNIAYLRNGSFFRPVSREAGRSGSGPRPHFALIDELHELTDRGVVDMLEAGFKFRTQPLLLMITNSGTDRKSLCWEQHERAIRICAGNNDADDDDATYLGEPLDDTYFGYVCALDKGDDPLTDPSCWPKANPLLGVILTEEYLAGRVKEATELPSKENMIKRLHFCVWTDAVVAWLPRRIVQPAMTEFDPLELHRRAPVSIGIDLSQTQDMTAKAVCAQSGVVKKGKYEGKPIYDVWIEAWTPKDTLESRAKRDRAPYEKWVKQGFLTATDGEAVDYMDVAQSVAEDDVAHKIEGVAYDAYAFKKFFAPELKELSVDPEMIEHPQGGVKKGAPIPAAVAKWEEACKGLPKEEWPDKPEGLWMPGSVRKVEQLLIQKRLRIRNNPVVISAIMSAKLEMDRWDNAWLSKQKSTNRIDAAVALCMAVGLATATEDLETMSLDDWIESI